jgi:hypothetical protein
MDDDWPVLPDTVTDGPVPVGGREGAGDAPGPGREIRRGPTANEGLIDQDFHAQVGAVTAGAAHACLGQMDVDLDRSAMYNG